MIRIISFIGILLCLPTNARGDEECVVLLHGLLRVSNSMAELGSKLDRSGYSVVNINYPSRRYEIDVLAADAVGRGLAECENQGSQTIHFVTHSLGGILLRYYVQQQSLPMLGRVVMLGPPNQGTEIVDGLSPVPGFGMLWGPTGAVLGTGPDSIVNELGPVSFELGVIAGDTNINPVNWFLMEGPNDSIVSVESTRVAGMAAHKVLPVTHSFMMRNNEVIDNTIHFLKTGSFIPE